MEGFYRQKEGGARKFLAREKKEFFPARSSSFEAKGMTGVLYADCFASADQEISGCLFKDRILRRG